MKRKYDVVVVGGGPVGLSTAYFVAGKGCDVLLVERDAIGYGAASASAGILVPSHCDPLTTGGNIREGIRSFFDRESAVHLYPRLDVHYPFWLLKFFRKSMSLAHFHRAVDIWKQINVQGIKIHQELAEEGGEVYQYRSDGHLALYITPKAFAHACGQSPRLRAAGVDNQVLTGEEARSLDPSVGPAVVGAIRVPGDAHMAPRAFLKWLAKQAEDRGAVILPHTEAYGFQTRGRMVSAVKTTKGEFQADQVVLTTGAWLPVLTRILGRRLPIEGAKGYGLTIKRPGNGPRIPLFLEDQGLVLTPYEDIIRIISRMDFAGLNNAIASARIDPMVGQAVRYVPSLAPSKVIEIRRGIRPCTVDGIPVMGRLFKVGNVFVGGGHDQKGLSLGPLTGLQISRLLSGEPAGDLERALSPERLWE